MNTNTFLPVLVALGIFAANVSADELPVMTQEVDGPLGVKVHIRLTKDNDEYELRGDLIPPFGGAGTPFEPKAGAVIKGKIDPKTGVLVLSAKSAVSAKNPITGRPSDAAWIDLTVHVKGGRVVAADGEIGGSDGRQPRRKHIWYHDGKFTTK